MKKLILFCGLLVSSFSFGADWKYAAMGAQDDRAIYVDSSQYNYDKKNNSIKAWFKTVSYKEAEGSETYTKSMNLFQFSCLDNKAKILAYVEYNKDGKVTSSAQRDSKDAKYDIVVPDTAGEDIWKVSCISRGNGFRFPKVQAGERISKKEMEKLFPEGYIPKKHSQKEIDKINKDFSAQ